MQFLLFFLSVYFFLCIFCANFYDYSAGVQLRSEGKLWPTATAGPFKIPSNQSQPFGFFLVQADGRAGGWLSRAIGLANWLTDWPTGPLMTFYIAKEATTQTKTQTQTLNQNQTSKLALVESARLGDALYPAVRCKTNFLLYIQNFTSLTTFVKCLKS